MMQLMDASLHTAIYSSGSLGESHVHFLFTASSQLSSHWLTFDKQFTGTLGVKAFRYGTRLLCFSGICIAAAELTGLEAPQRSGALTAHQAFLISSFVERARCLGEKVLAAAVFRSSYCYICRACQVACEHFKASGLRRTNAKVKNAACSRGKSELRHHVAEQQMLHCA